MDETIQNAERNGAAHLRDADTRALRAVQEALRRMDAGTWGTCVDCAERIEKKRLAAVLDAARCRGCQEQVEREARHA